MKKNKILINIENLKDIEYYKKIGINNFLFAVNDFSIGYKSFELEYLKDLDCNKYLLINRILNNEDCDNLKNIINKLIEFDGIIFEDIAVYNILKDYDINLIWNQSHFATNTSSINYWLDMCNSAVISNELTKEEVKDILDNSNKKLILNMFGKNPIMYSRRTLLTNFNKNFGLADNKLVILKENITNNEFKAIETDKGTFILNNKYFNLYPYINELNQEKILFYLIYPCELEKEEVLNIINGEKIENSDDGFMNRKTIYKLKG